MTESKQSKELILYGRTSFCPDQERALRFLEAKGVPFTRINIDQNREGAELLKRYVGHLSVPTLVIANQGQTLPAAEPTPLPANRSARSFDRGTMITEPSDTALGEFLTRNGLL